MFHALHVADKHQYQLDQEILHSPLNYDSKNLGLTLHRSIDTIGIIFDGLRPVREFSNFSNVSL